MTFNLAPMQGSHCQHLVFIERHSDENFWCRQDFETFLKSRNCSGIVAKEGHKLIGFVAFETLGRQGIIQIHNLVIHTTRRKKGVGRALVNELKILTGCEFESLRANVRESNLDAQLFWQRLGFRAWGIAEKYFLDYFGGDVYEENAYCFEFSAEPQNAHIVITNRHGTPLRRHVPRVCRNGSYSERIILSE